ncbi:MAG TPA: hypothetical protein VIF82_13275 [Burkholderiaceae bacterium]
MKKMTSLSTPTFVEKLADNLSTQSALTVVSALSGGPLAALLPVLATTLASGRQRQRVEEALVLIDKTLQEHASFLQSISDAQYKLVNESILAVLHTTSKEKLGYLRRVVQNTITSGSFLQSEADILSRVIRDISAEEVEFILLNFKFDQIQLVSKLSEHPSHILQLLIGSPEGIIVPGLISLGILVSAGGSYEELGTVRFMPITAKLIVLLRNDSQSFSSENL